MRRRNRILKYFVLSLFVVGVGVGCGQKEETVELTPSFEEGSTTVVELGAPTASESSNMTVVSASAPLSTSPAPSTFSTVTPLPQDSLQRARTIQLALKEAGYYGGNIDGKAGPLTQKAVEDFQTAKGLKADGKVGPMTWAELGKYLPQETSSQ